MSPLVGEQRIIPTEDYSNRRTGPSASSERFRVRTTPITVGDTETGIYVADDGYSSH